MKTAEFLFMAVLLLILPEKITVYGQGSSEGQEVLLIITDSAIPTPCFSA